MAKTIKHRVLIISHAHPDFSKGGAEIAAYNLYKALNARDDCDALFLARQGNSSLSRCGAEFSSGADGSEILYHSNIDYFQFASSHPRSIWTGFRSLLERFRPTVVHFHHYTHLGLEMIREVKNYSMAVPVFLTLHEYLAICDRDGQMLKTDGRLCWKASPAECHICRPQRSKADYFMRELYIKSFFDLVDQFVAPSQFLLERYVAWGVPRQKLVFLENGQLEITPPPPRELLPGEVRGRFAYFGQITPYKGVDILLEAIGKLPDEVKKQVTLEIHGSGLESQPVAFRDKINALMEKEKECVCFHGPYEPHELTKRMARIDWVVVPSIWWENSPLVIQEAFNHRRPVICSDIGGMAEKVVDGKTGLHFQARNAFDLAGCMRMAVTTEGLWERLTDSFFRPLSVDEFAEEQIKLYGISVAHEPMGFSVESGLSDMAEMRNASRKAKSARKLAIRD